MVDVVREVTPDGAGDVDLAAAHLPAPPNATPAARWRSNIDNSCSFLNPTPDPPVGFAPSADRKVGSGNRFRCSWGQAAIETG
jgi:hypothetical protein